MGGVLLLSLQTSPTTGSLKKRKNRPSGARYCEGCKFRLLALRNETMVDTMTFAGI